MGVRRRIVMVLVACGALWGLNGWTVDANRTGAGASARARGIEDGIREGERRADVDTVRRYDPRIAGPHRSAARESINRRNRRIAAECAASAECREWVAVSIWRATFQDARPIGCPSGYRCVRGGIRSARPCAIPAHICWRESKGWLDVQAGTGSGHWGKYQFGQRTFDEGCRRAGYWMYVGVNPGAAPEKVQDAAASAIWDGGRGAGHWSL